MKLPLGIVIAVVATAHGQPPLSPKIRTVNNDMVLEVPAGSDVRVDEISYTNGNPQWTPIASIRDIVATGSQLSQTVETMHVELTAAVSLAAAEMQTAAAEMQTSVTSSLVAMTGEQSTAIAATRGQCRSDLQEAAAQFNRSLAAKDAEIQHLVSALVPSKPANFTVSPGPWSVELDYREIESPIYPLNVTVQVATMANFTNGSPAWENLEQGFTVANSEHSASLQANRLNLTKLTPYVVRYRAANVVGAGPWSDVQAFNTTDSNVARSFECRANDADIRGQQTMCEVRITIQEESVFYVWFQGHYRNDGGWTYGKISFNDDNMGPRQIDAPAHGYSSSWEQFHSARAQTMPPGTHVIKTTLHCSSRCRLSGFGMQGFHMTKSPSHQTDKCKYSSWAWPFGRNQPMCELAYRVTEPSIVAATFGGHARDNHVYAAVSYDRDRPQRGAQYLMAHTYSTNWENFGSHRTAFVTAGSHTTGAVDWSCQMCGSLNGAGLSHIVFPAEVGAAQVFRATRGWSFSAGSTPVRVTRATINLPFNSLVFAQTSGHYNQRCLIAITFDQDNVNWMRDPGSSNTWGNKMAHYGETGNWEAVFMKRSKVLGPGRHFVDVWMRCYNSGGFNGMGMDGFYVRSATAPE
jgi:hypothetical protein